MEVFKKADQWLKELNSKENLLNCVTVGIMGGNQVKQVVKSMGRNCFCNNVFYCCLKISYFEGTLLLKGWTLVKKEV